jgi:hypothetical protein
MPNAGRSSPLRPPPHRATESVNTGQDLSDAICNLSKCNDKATLLAVSAEFGNLVSFGRWLIPVLFQVKAATGT